ncbi:DUF6701 domain-containing protein [Pseudothauera lacus]|nr:DUF6701 domain-containing protein [Pseudothauera lacus]
MTGQLITPASSCLGRGIIAVLLTLCTVLPAHAANFGLNGSPGNPGNYPTCSGGSWSASGSTRTCSGSITLSAGDSIVPNSELTLIVFGGITLQGNNTLGSATDRLDVQTRWGAIQANGTGNTLYGNLSSTSSGAINLNGTNLTGTILTNGSSNLTDSTVSGTVNARSGVTARDTEIGGDITANSGEIRLSGGRVSGDVESACCRVYATDTDISGSITANNGRITLVGGTVIGNVHSNCCAVIATNTDITGNVSSNGSPVSISGGTILGNITASSNTITLTTNTTVVGNVTAGGWNGSLSIDGSSRVIGICTPDHPRCNASALPPPVAAYAMDEAVWSGATGEVVDGSGNARHGTAIDGAATTAPGAICRAGRFDGGSHVQVDNLSSVLSGTASLSFWIRTTQTGDDTNWRAPGVSGVEQAGGTNDIFWGWLDASGRIGISKGNDDNARSTVAINDGQWHHIVLTRNASSGAYTIYIDGSLNRSGTTGSGAVTTPFSSIGRIENTNASAAAAYLVGDVDEVLIFDSVLDAGQVADIHAKQSAGKNLDGSERLCPPAFQCVSDNFARSEVGDDWAVTNRSGSFGNPRIVDGRLRLTDNTANVATAATFQRVFPSAGNLVTLEFDFHAYGGSGADGIAVVLSDAAQTPAPGGYGGSLGYANRSGVSGFAGGWIGVALDTYGNYSNPTEGRNGGPGRRQNSVAMRGSGSGQTGYAYIAGTATLSPTLRTTAGQRYRITIDSQTAGQSWVTVERDTGSGFQTLIGPVNVLASAGQAAVPENLLLTLTGSTGGSNDNHEIDNLDVCALRMEPLQNPINHFRIVHDGSGLTCAPESVTIQACANNACSALYAGSVDLTLQPANTSSQYWLGGSNSKTFSGGSAVFQLRRNTAGTATLGIATSIPTAANVTRCFRNGVEGNCTLQFNASGLVFDIPTLIANRPQGEIVISARRTDPANPETCAPALTGARTVGFRSQYADPATGSARVHVDGSAISNTATWTNLTLDFDANADARISVRYADAGLMTLLARYQGSAANEDSGLTLNGSDDFVVKPAGFCIDSSAAGAHCLAGDHTCPAFARAGALFPLGIRAVAWEVDGDGDLCTGNATTPNYRQGGIVLGSEVVAPLAGQPGSTGVNALDLVAADGGERNLQQSVSEVGVFRFTATPPAGAYFGETVAGGHSLPIGRFIPARLAASANTPVLENACNASFTYLGSPFGYLVAPQLTVSGLNIAGGVTLNYAGPFWRLPAALGGRSHGNAAATAATLAEDDAGTVAWSGTEIYDGSAVASLTNVQLRYGKPATPLAPFAASVDLDIPAAALTDSDGACYDANGDGACDALRIGAIAGTELRWGRLAVDNAHQHLETQPVNVVVRAEHYDGSRFVTNADDNCSALGAPAHLRLDNNQQNGRVDGSIAVGNGSTTASGFGTFAAGVLQLQFSAPGAGNPGFVDLTPQLNAAGMSWLGAPDTPRGRATWGLYRGNPSVIRMREVWR